MVTTLFAVIAALLSATASRPLSAQCNTVVKAEENGLPSPNGKPRGAALISANPITVPELRLRFIDAKTGHLVTPKKVTISYTWKWLEYPYPEHIWGAWSDAYDFMSCSIPAGSDELVVPQYVVIPRGWYKGKYTDFPWSRKPKFGGVGLTIETSDCTSRLGINEADFRRYDGATAIIKLDCPNTPKVSFVKR